MPDSVSIVIPVRNSRGTIEACLQSLLENVPADARQIIVIDNGSTDNTPELVRRYPVELYYSSAKSVAASRNAGVRRARYPLIAFVDSDCVVRPPWFETILSMLLDPKVGIVGCRYELRDAPTWVEQAWNTSHADGQRRAEPHDVEYVPGGNLAMRREAFDRVHGFDPAIETGEDMDLCQRTTASGYRVVQTSRMVCVHLGEPRTLGAVFRRNRWHGRGARFRYPNGRLAPVLIGTFLFASLILAAAFATVEGLWTHRWILLALLALPAVVPVVYAAKYARAPGRLGHFTQLIPIYGAYFIGRAYALPVVVREYWRGAATGKTRRARQPNSGRETGETSQEDTHA